jgi:hypothetical protein
MEPIEQYFENVRRSAIAIKKQRPFLDWLLLHDKEMIVDEMMLEGDVYLLPDFETTKEMEKWMKKHFDMLFTDQLNGWYTDKSMWPQNRTFKLFKEWFTYSLYTMVWDTQEDFIEKK